MKYIIKRNINLFGKINIIKFGYNVKINNNGNGFENFDIGNEEIIISNLLKPLNQKRILHPYNSERQPVNPYCFQRKHKRRIIWMNGIKYRAYARYLIFIGFNRPDGSNITYFEKSSRLE